MLPQVAQRDIGQVMQNVSTSASNFPIFEGRRARETLTLKRQERLRRRYAVEFRSTLGKTCPKVPEIAAAGSREGTGGWLRRRSVMPQLAQVHFRLLCKAM